VKAIKVPPTFVTSGSLDDKVDPDGARLLVKKMEELGMDVEWDHRVGADHLFDQNPEEKMERMHVFLERHLS
jgi:prolyl oligopeptidase PreP (S9A serine peptidase family)